MLPAKSTKPSTLITESNCIHSDFLLGLGPHGFHRLHYTEWGSRNNPNVIFCVHGLTRNSRDFDRVASKLAGRYRVICPDMPGRGLSDWLVHCSDYNLTLYMADIVALLARSGVEKIDWLGTSMGGLIGLLIAAQPNSPIKRLLLNDIGPCISERSRHRIMEYLGRDPRFPNLASLEDYIRRIHAPFGPLSDAQWHHLAKHSAKKIDNGYALHYDPGIADGFKNLASATTSLWPVWDALKCPVKVFRGSNSDLLSATTAAEMANRGPKAEITEFPGIGHAPALMSEDQITAVIEWFNP